MPRRHFAGALVAGGLALALTACGSQLAPNDVARANAGLQGPALSQAGTLATHAPVTTNSGGAGPAGSTSSTSGTLTTGTAGIIPGPVASTGSGPGQQPAACAGIKVQTGITKDAIVIANASDISGPVPGLFQSAQDATKAFVAYFNATSSICGHKLSVLSLDTRTDSGADQEAYATACAQSFAAVGSMAGFDNGGAATAQGCGLPDIRAAGVSLARQRCTTCFGVEAVNSNTFENAVPDHILKDYPAAAQKAAMLYLNAATAPANGHAQVTAMQRRGMHFVYEQGIDISDFNYAPYVQQMKNLGVRYVQFIGPYQNGVRLAQAMQQQSMKPDIFAYDPTAYDSGYAQSGGSAVEGTQVFLNTALFEEATSNKEMALYESWLNQVHPGAAPTFFGVYAWSATRLFVEEALKLGGNLSRASLVQALTRVDNWTGNGIHAPQHVGAKQTADCWRWIVLHNGAWQPMDGTSYVCHGVSKAN